MYTPVVPFRHYLTLSTLVLHIYVTNVTLSSKGTHLRMFSMCKMNPRLLTDPFYSDFPGGEGEAQFKGRAGVADIPDAAGRRALGFEPFKYSTYLNEGERAVVAAANQILGF